LLLAHKWENDVDLTGWWMSEKLDGVRAYWNGTTFLSRLGNEFHAPDWFVEELGDEPLDGELWVGRQEFQRTVSIVRRQDRSDLWKEVRYVVFDAPGEKGSFEERMEVARTRLEGLTYASALAQEPCESLAHLRKELARVEGLGGEGLMLRKPGSKYVAGRSSTLLKVKTFHDAEGVVVGYVPGKGKHKGRTGALILELEDGTRFNAGTGLSDKEREDPPAVGAVVTFRYQELTKAGVPRFPSYVGERVDITMSVPSLGAAPKPAKIKTTGGKVASKSKAAAKSSKASKSKGPSKPAPKSSARRVIEIGDERWSVARRGRIVSIKRQRRYESEAEAKAALDAFIAKKTKEKAAATAKSATPGSAGVTRYFEFVGGVSAKFWEITIQGTEHTVRYGRIGANGAKKTKSFADETSMQASADKLIQQKVDKGYVETTA
ncbi:MAG: DNA ligase, partial [Myxococcota bacterium]